MCFAQRKFMGFRCKYEYDAKAVLVYTDKQICLLSYTLESLGESSVPNLAAAFHAANEKGSKKQKQQVGDEDSDECTSGLGSLD